MTTELFMPEEAWFENHVSEETGEEEALRLYYAAWVAADDLAGRISDGEIVDEAEGKIIIDNLVYSKSFLAGGFGTFPSVKAGEPLSAYLSRARAQKKGGGAGV